MKRLLLAALAAATLLVAAPAAPAPRATFPLHLGSHGVRVRDAQYQLAGHNVFHVRTYHGRIDGRFGPHTRAAVLEMKRELGYRRDQIRPVFGRDLRELLLGKRKLPPLYAVRRARRHPFVTIKQSYPLARRGAIIGVPGAGTHSFTSPPNNWQSDRAVDIAIAVGTPVLAVGNGHVCGGCGFGAFSSSLGSRFAGRRLTLQALGDSWYYAHLTAYAPGIHPGARVHAGQVLGFSGSANGVAHLHFACQRCDVLRYVKGR
jgi:Peptidase family M23